MRLLFVSTMFLYPVDTGAKIRTTQVLRGLRGGQFDVTLACPATTTELEQHRDDLAAFADRVVHWPAVPRNGWFRISRMRHLCSRLPIPVVTDRSRAGRETVAALLSERPDVVVVDFPHAMVLLPQEVSVPLVLFTHNVEAEIFARHRDVSIDPVRRAIWQNQYRKMVRYEDAVIKQADVVVAVSERDSQILEKDYAGEQVRVIPTGVDLDFYAWQPPANSREIVFCGSMDWLANIDGVRFLLDDIWPQVLAAEPDATVTIVGRDPPKNLVDEVARRDFNWRFTGWVEDTRPFIQRGAAFVIPLRVGGGTRLKVYEAMAMGVPVVSTSIGVEGLPVTHGQHCLIGDSAEELAACLISTLRDADLRQTLSSTAREYVEKNFSFRNAAAVFEEICLDVVPSRCDVTAS